MVSLYSDDDRYDETYLSNYAMINLQYPLARLPGVGQVKVIGAGPYSMRVWLDPNKLQYYHLTTMDVVNAIQQQNVQVVAGQARGAAGAAPTRPFSSPSTPWEGSPTSSSSKISLSRACAASKAETAQIVRVKDLARVELSQQVYSNFAGLSGHKAAHILIYSSAGGQRHRRRPERAEGHGRDEQGLSRKA